MCVRCFICLLTVICYLFLWCPLGLHDTVALNLHTLNSIYVMFAFCCIVSCFIHWEPHVIHGLHILTARLTSNASFLLIVDLCHCRMPWSNLFIVFLVVSYRLWCVLFHAHFHFDDVSFLHSSHCCCWRKGFF